MPVMRSLVLIFMLLVFVTRAVAEAAWSELPSLSATLVSKNRHHERMSDDVEIAISTYGLKMSSNNLLFGRSGVLLQDFSTNKSWLLDRQHKTFARLPEISEEEDDGAATALEAGILSSRPCLGEHYNKASKVKEYADANIEVWECWMADVRTEQHYHQLHKVVVKEIYPDDSYLALTNIRSREFNREAFHPHNSFREVSLKEMAIGLPELKPYP